MFEKEGAECEFCDNDTKALIEKFLTICVPVKVTPNVEVKPVRTECCGEPIISSKRCQRCSSDNGHNCCEFSIIQKMKVIIPIKFSVDTDIGDAFVDCELRDDSNT